MDDAERYITIFGVSSVVSILIFFLFYVNFAQIFLRTIIGNYENSIALALLIIGLLLMSLIIMVVVSYLASDREFRSSFLLSSLLSLFLDFIILISIGYFWLFFVHPEAFTWDPAMSIILFSLYGLPHPIFLFILNSVIFSAIYTFFLYIFERG